MIDKIFGRSTIIYYIFLLLILVTWTNVDSLPPLPLRLAYLTAIMGPLWKERSLSTPIVLFTFVVISGSSFAISYMPVDGLYISIVLLISYMLCRPNIDRIKFPSALIILTILSLFVDFFSVEFCIVVVFKGFFTEVIIMRCGFFTVIFACIKRVL